MQAKFSEFRLHYPISDEVGSAVVARRKNGVSLSSAAMLLIFSLFSSIRGLPQAQPPASAGDTGISNYQSYDGGKDSVNLGTGNVTVTVPLLTLPGRNHLDYSVGLIFNSHNWGWQQPQNWYNSDIGMAVTRTGAVYLGSTGTYQLISGAEGQAGSVSCETPFVMVDDTGGQHTLPTRTGCTILTFIPLPGGGSDPVFENDYSENAGGADPVNGIFMDVSGSVSNSDPYGCSVDYSNGNRTWLTQCPNGADYVSAGSSVLEDANGNYITSGAGGPGGAGTGIAGGADNFPSGIDTDTLARSITFNSSNHTIKYYDSSGAARTITLNVTPLTLSCPLAAYNYPSGAPSDAASPTGTPNVIKR
jgi:hypothetical protein